MSGLVLVLQIIGLLLILQMTGLVHNVRITVRETSTRYPGQSTIELFDTEAAKRLTVKIRYFD